MAVTISPVLAPDLAVALDITANGPADDLWHWTIDQPEPGSITTPIVTDGNGPVATQVTAKPDGWSLQLWQRIRTIASDQCPR